MEPVWDWIVASGAKCMVETRDDRPSAQTNLGNHVAICAKYLSKVAPLASSLARQGGFTGLDGCPLLLFPPNKNASAIAIDSLSGTTSISISFPLYLTRICIRCQQVRELTEKCGLARGPEPDFSLIQAICKLCIAPQNLQTVTLIGLLCCNTHNNSLPFRSHQTARFSVNFAAAIRATH